MYSIRCVSAIYHSLYMYITAGLYTPCTCTCTMYVLAFRNCLDIVRDIFDERQREGYPNPEEEQAELRRLGEEEGKWSELATLLLDQLSQGDTTATAGDGDSKEKESSEGGGGEEELKGDSAMSVLGPDENLHAKTLSQASDETPAGPAATRTELGLHTEDSEFTPVINCPH